MLFLAGNPGCGYDSSKQHTPQSSPASKPPGRKNTDKQKVSCFCLSLSFSRLAKLSVVIVLFLICESNSIQYGFKQLLVVGSCLLSAGLKKKILVYRSQNGLLLCLPTLMVKNIY